MKKLMLFFYALPALGLVSPTCKAQDFFQQRTVTTQTDTQQFSRPAPQLLLQQGGYSAGGGGCGGASPLFLPRREFAGGGFVPFGVKVNVGVGRGAFRGGRFGFGRRLLW